MKKYTHEKAHEEIDYIFKTLLPQRGMAERPEQIRLCHSILDAMLDGSIALCDAGTGIGKTFAYLTAGILHGKCRAAEGKPQRPILISTSSIALQSAIQKEYLPLLSSVLLSEGLISAPIEAVIRKGKAHYACDARLERRVRQVEGSHKNPAARQALHTAWHVLDLDQLSGMSSYDRGRICVPKRCNCRRKDCRYGAARTAQEGAGAMTRRSHGRPALPPKAKAEILEVLFANMEISGDEIAAILKKHHVSCDVDILQDRYRRQLGQRLMASLRDASGEREVLSNGKGRYVVLECCRDRQQLAAIRRRIQNQAHGLNASAGKVRSRIAVLDRLIVRLRKAA